MISRYLKHRSVLAMLAAAGLFAGSPAMAVVVSGSGGSDARIDVRSDTSSIAASPTAFVDFPGASIVVTIPAGQSRLLIARFAAESMCNGAAAAPSAWCSLQIIATRTSGTRVASVAFDPASGLDYAFDSNPPGVADDRFESNAMERSKRLSEGTYRIRVQWAVIDGGTSFRLDDWHFSVETRL